MKLKKYYKKLKIILYLAVRVSMFSMEDIESIEGNLEEVILKVIVKNRSEHIYGYIDREKEDVYLESDDILMFLEIPTKNKELIKDYIVNEKYLNITKMYKEGKFEIEEYKADFENSILIINPSWEMKAEKEEKILKRREQIKNYKNNLEKKNVIREEWKLFTLGNLKLGVSRENFLKSSDTRVYFNYINNILYGNLNLSGESREDSLEVDYLYWQRDFGDNKKILLGDYYRKTLFSYGKNSRIKGVTIGEKNSWDSITSINSRFVTGFAVSGTVVELYRNNILVDYQVVQNGEYRFEIDISNGSNEYILKKYLDSGQIIEEKLSLYGNEKILKENEFDYSLELGEDDKNKSLYNFQIRYGVDEDLSLGIGGFNTLDKKDESKDFLTLSEIGTFEIPYIGVPILHEIYLATKDENQYSYRYRVSTNKKGVELSYRFEDNKRLLEEYDSNTSKIVNSDLQLSTTINRWNTRVGYNKYKDSYSKDVIEYYSNFGRSVKRIYMNFGLKRIERSEKNNFDFDLGFSYSLRESEFAYKFVDMISTSFNFDKENKNYSLNMGKNIGKGDWGYNINFNIDDKDNKNYGVSISYTPGKVVNLQSNFYGDKKSLQRISSTVETNIYLNNNEVEVGYGEFSGWGSIAGKTYIDRNGNSIYDDGDELIQANIDGNLNRETKEVNGEFSMSGLQTYKDMEVTVELTSEDAEYNVENKIKKSLKLNPGGTLETGFGFRPNTTVVSNVEFNNSFYYEEISQILKNLKIKYRNLITDEIHLFSWEDDSIFIKELPVGRYEIEIEYLEEEKFEINNEKFILDIGSEDYLEVYFKIDSNLENKYKLVIEI